MFRPQFRYTRAVVENLLSAERARATIDVIPLSDGAVHELRIASKRARTESAPKPSGKLAPGFAAAYTGLESDSTDAFDEEDLHSLASSLAGHQAVYRDSTSLIYDEAHTELIYLPPEFEDVPALISALMDWLDAAWDAIPAIVLAGIAHQELGLIQPYDENNRLLSHLAGLTVLARQGYGFRGYAAVDAHMERHPRDYEAAARSSHAGVHSNQPDFTPWLEYFSGQVATAGQLAAKDVMRRFAAATPAPQPAGPELPIVLRDRQLSALQYMRDNGAIRSGQYQRLAHIVPDTARRDFDDLLDKALIEVRGVGRGTYYVLTAKGVEQAERRRPD